MMSKQEKVAWVRLTASAIAVVTLAWAVATMPQASAIFVWGDPMSMIVATCIAIASIALLPTTFGHGVADERDRQIEASANRTGFRTLYLLLLCLAFIAGTDGAMALVQERSAGWIKLFLFLCMCLGSCVHALVGIGCYRRDRA